MPNFFGEVKIDTKGRVMRKNSDICDRSGIYM
jgi:hypothetical protein